MLSDEETPMQAEYVEGNHFTSVELSDIAFREGPSRDSLTMVIHHTIDTRLGALLCKTRPLPHGWHHPAYDVMSLFLSVFASGHPPAPFAALTLLGSFSLQSRFFFLPMFLGVSLQPHPMDTS